MLHVISQNQLGGIFTKTLNLIQIRDLVNMMGMINILLHLEVGC